MLLEEFDFAIIICFRHKLKMALYFLSSFAFLFWVQILTKIALIEGLVPDVAPDGIVKSLTGAEIPNVPDHIPSIKDISQALFNDEKKYIEPYVNSTIIKTLVPAFLLALATQKHAPDTQKTVNKRYDYIIVGAGSSGSALAARLAEVPCAKILLLEAGKNPPTLTEVPSFARAFVTTDIDWDYLTEPQEFTGAGLKDRRLNFPAGKVIGGSSIINAMLYVRGHRKIYDEWAEKYGATGWSYEEILPYFKKLEHNKNPELVEKEYHGFDGPVTFTKPKFTTDYKDAIIKSYKNRGLSSIDVNGRYEKGVYEYQSNTKLGQRCSAAKGYLVPASKKSNLDIVEKAYVEKVLINKHKRAIGVRVNISGHVQNIYANKEVILSAGTVNSAQLLMLSGIGPRKHLEDLKIKVIADLPVGEGLQDHAGPIVGYYSDSSPYIERLFYPENIAKYVGLREGIWASSEAVQFISLLTNDLASSADAVPDYELYFIHGVDKIAEITFNIDPKVYKQVFLPYKHTSTLWCIAQNLHSKSRGFVKLRSKNPYDGPIIDPKYFSHPQDLIDVIEGMTECDRVASSEPFEELGLKPFETLYPGCENFKNRTDYLRCQAESVVFTLSHQTGTVRMGDPEKPSTVVDPTLKVKHIKGLRVVDCSIMPQVPSSNTNVPAMMIGEKAADMIKEEMDKSCDDE